MIEVKNLTKKFGDKTVLDNISVQFETGKTNLIIGQSGSGKTVLMKSRYDVSSLKRHRTIFSRASGIPR